MSNSDNVAPQNRGTAFLAHDQVAAYERDGFLVLEGFVDTDACAQLRDRANELVVALASASRSVFSTDEQQRTSDELFLTSGDTIACFYEEAAFDADGELVHDQALAINKLGHAMHDLDPVFERFSRTPALAAVAADLGLVEPRLLQSMYIFKQPHIGGEVTSHQDATFLYTDPISVTGFWFAIEDATIENGCLWATPGGHRGGLRQRFVRNGGDADGTRFEVVDPTPLPDAPLVPIEAAAGTMVVLHGLLPHRSGANTSPRSRHAYSLHIIDGSARYPDDNWLRRRPERPPRGF